MSNSPDINSDLDKSGTAEVSFEVSFIDDCELVDVLELVFSSSIQPEIRIIPTTNKQITDNFFINTHFSHLIA
ncbi:MAG: hypothetical protein K8R19_01730 [Methanosarcinales archaeon]|nr:hypothetical protein [Methanosarcinales archaeon]